ncbi:recombinase family protein [Baekduia sp.]|jgi:DNA invertase Pin-like site-specific DNA recombinase|uniref:recombinase family protein n=1 Tax=Baekduia sp. TaxID=2600305 RepID=UPI002DFEECFE|nr:recombinase family protein [Baekduia sp.]
MNEEQQLKERDGTSGLAGSAAIYVRVSSTGQLGRDGDDDGYSIPAQVKACQRIAEDRGLRVAKVYVERAESARSDNRPVLQQMMVELSVLRVEALIVHKVDRLARNRLDDAQLYQRLVAMNTALISATENIDATPAGQLMHGMLATFAEYYSNNLANEVKKGLTQKHANGGTPYAPPVGYVPVRTMIGHQDIRTVELDEERAPLVTMAFELYATGEWTLIALTAHMAALGLTTRPSLKRPAKALGVSSIHRLLTNEYYTGIVPYLGKRVVGRHDALVTAETFQQVQVNVAAHRKGERASKHEHYLRGTVVCELCKGRLLFGRHRGRNGQHYEYFSCVNRASRRRTNVMCPAAHSRVDVVEERIEDLWATVRLRPETIETIRRDLAQYSKERAEVADKEIARHKRRIRDVETKQQKLLELYYKDLISDTVFEHEQAELREQHAAVAAIVEHSEGAAEEFEGQLQAAIALLSDPHYFYRYATPVQRRALNRWVWQRIEVGADDEVIEAEPTSLLAAFAAWQPDIGTAQDAGSSSGSAFRSYSSVGHLLHEGRTPAPPG